MPRTNVVSWVDVKVLTKFVTQLLVEMAEYAHRGYNERSTLFGDQEVMISLITIRKRIDEIIAKHERANPKESTDAS